MRKSMNMGGSVVSRNILEGKGKLKWFRITIGTIFKFIIFFCAELSIF